MKGIPCLLLASYIHTTDKATFTVLFLQCVRKLFNAELIVHILIRVSNAIYLCNDIKEMVTTHTALMHLHEHTMLLVR